jgi:hypothetical protein
MCPFAWKAVDMGNGVIALDSILSATFFFVGKWTPALKRNQSRDLLRFILCRLYDEGRGNLTNAQLILAQTTLARKLGLSRQWIGILLAWLQDAGWIEYYSPTLPDGTNGSTIFRIGRQLKRLLIMLAKARQRKKPIKSDAKSTWRFSPRRLEKQEMLIREKENQPLSQRTLEKIPLLKQWMKRGEGTL